jgi:methionyl aminopeptidase
MDISNYYKAASIHKKIRKELDAYVDENISLIDICSFIETKIKHYSDKTEINNGIAFPVGLSLNSIAAHSTPFGNTDIYLKKSDVLKIDYGVHVGGCIIDSAFTWTRDNTYRPLLDASREAVDTIINHIGVDTMISEIGTLSEEIVYSYEIEENGVLKPIKPIENLCGHSILPWKIHGGKLIQNVRNSDSTRIEENDVLAIEVFTSTGNGATILGAPNTHFMLSDSNRPVSRRSEELLSTIKEKFRTLAFTQRYIAPHTPIKYYDVCLDELYRKGYLSRHPPLIETDRQCKTAQFEDTIFVSENKVINLSGNI